MLAKRRRVRRRPDVLRYLLLRLFFALLCFFSILALIEVSLGIKLLLQVDWLVSLLLYLASALVIMAAAFMYSMRRAVRAGIVVSVLSYLLEVWGANTGFPFGRYSYTALLFPVLPGGVPLPIMLAWVLIIFSVYSWFRSRRPGLRLSIADVLIAGLTVMLLDGALEPIAAYVIGYRHWVDEASFFYHIPLINFAGWFVLGALLVWVVDRQFAPASRPRIDPPRMVFWLPRLLWMCSLSLLGIVDLAYGYYGGAICALLAILIVWPYGRRR